MTDKYQYRLSKDQKNEIAQNLIAILQNDATITKETRIFISEWILTGPEEKRKAFFDVWDIVLKNYLPKTRPILFRACDRISKRDKIVSFTGRLESARRFSKCKGYLLVCDTEENLKFEEKLYKTGKYKNTFYPLVSVLAKAKKSGGWGFSDRILTNYFGEDEYIMRNNLGSICCLKWGKDNFLKTPVHNIVK